MNKQRALAMAKVMAAIAWADQQLDNDEINVIKDLVHAHFSREQFTSADWVELDCYFIAPVGSAERQRLIWDLLRHLLWQSQVNKAWQHLSQLATHAGEAENEALIEVHTAIEHHRPWWFWQRWLTRPPHPELQREGYLRDYHDHELAFAAMCTLWVQGETKPDLEALRRGGALTGIFMWVARSDGYLATAEEQTIHHLLQHKWSIPDYLIPPLLESGQRRGGRLDLYKCARHLRQHCAHGQRCVLLEQCFALANSHANTSAEEIASIRKLATDLGLEHQDFINAKLTIDQADRASGH